MTRSMVLGNLLGRLAILIRETINMMKGMDMGKCTLQMVQFIRETGIGEFSVDKQRCS